MSSQINIRNVAIIAHVDHGKTTLLDNILRQSGTFRDNQQVSERVMDSGDLERERGITILAKCTSIMLSENEKVNIIDTPGHTDFGGEVERILTMADGVILLVDAAEGPMPQTKFVLEKALAVGLCPIVIINKIDRPDRREDEVLEEIIELFMALKANDKQLNFPVLYSSGRAGWCISDLNDERKDLQPLFDLLLSYVPLRKYDYDAPFSMLATILEYDRFLGRVLTGRIHSGSIKPNADVKVLNCEGKVVASRARVTKVLSFAGLTRVATEEAFAGDIISIAGVPEASVSDTIGALTLENCIHAQPIDPPTMTVTIGINDSPLGGKSGGTKFSSASIYERLSLEAESNVSIKVSKLPNQTDAFEVGGRGELQLGILIETMRREGFELSVSRPKVLFKRDANGQLLEPIEEVVIDVDVDYSGVVVEKLSARRGEMMDMRESGHGRMRIKFLAPSRGLIGYQGECLTDTKGTALVNRVMHSYQPYKGELSSRKNGVLISTEDGKAVAYALFNLQDRGIMFVKPQDKVYAGMIVGENNRSGDLEINVTKTKQLTNIRAAGSDEAVRLNAPRLMTLEEMMAYVEDGEMVEVTPEALRLRKALLNPADRKRAQKKSEPNC